MAPAQAAVLPMPPQVPLPKIDLYSLLDLPPDDARVHDVLVQVARETEKGKQVLGERQEKKYSDATYHLHPALSLSYCFPPRPPSLINQIDLTSPVPPQAPPHPLANASGSSSTSEAATPTPAPLPPCPLDKASALPWPLTIHSTLLDLLPVLGEPARKGGGLDNVGRLGPGVWVEWSDVRWPWTTDGQADPSEGDHKRRGLYVEFEVRGAGCWERSSLEGQRWKSCMLFYS